ncbi:MAG TPA: flavodoxin domain-containing protein, partial [Ktedonobacteraceae bacterium]
MPHNLATDPLVAYATRYGSTQEVAETVATTLRESGLEVELQPLRQVHTIDQYRAIVIGAPLYMFHWHKDALNFLTKYHKTLISLPVAIFALGPFRADEKEFQGAREQLDKELEKFSWLIPATIEIFGGKFDPEKLTFPHNLVPVLKKMPASDVRDWTAI